MEPQIEVPEFVQRAVMDQLDERLLRIKLERLWLNIAAVAALAIACWGIRFNRVSQGYLTIPSSAWYTDSVVAMWLLIHPEDE